ncbi:hypothetical protein [Endozoicomonas sp.]|nr:hypothetical protein [Endozoicomonas sp.]
MFGFVYSPDDELIGISFATMESLRDEDSDDSNARIYTFTS